MQTFGQLLGSNPSALSREVSQLPHVGAIGIELELEGLNGIGNVRGWQTHSDGSLRDGVEYVFDGPQSGEVALASMLAMGEYLQRNRPDPTFRCSTHIHVDVRDLNMLEYDKLVSLYAMVEHVLFDHCAPERRFSNFCTPFFVSNRLMRTYHEIFKAPPLPSHKVRNLASWPKYSALNLKVSQQYGSIEFRGSHALTTSEDLVSLAQRMLHLKRMVKESNDEETVLQFITRCHNTMIQDIFLSGLRNGYVQDAVDADNGFSNALYLATRSWGYDENHRDHAAEASFVPEAPRPSRINRGPATVWVHVNTSTLEAYNISTEAIMLNDMGCAPLARILQLYIALQSIHGLEPPRLSQLISLDYQTYNPGMTAHSVANTFSRLNLETSHWR